MNRLTAMLALVASLSFCISLFLIIQTVQARSDSTNEFFSLGYEQEAQDLAQNWIYADQ